MTITRLCRSPLIFSERLQVSLASQGSSRHQLAGKREAPTTAHHGEAGCLPLCREVPAADAAGLIHSQDGSYWRCQAGGLLGMPRVTCQLPQARLLCALPPCPGEAWHFTCVQPTHTQSIGTQTSLSDKRCAALPTAPPLHLGKKTVCDRLSPLSQEAPQAFQPPASCLSVGQAQTRLDPHGKTVLLHLGPHAAQSQTAMQPGENIWIQEYGADAQTAEGRDGQSGGRGSG